MPPLDGSTSNPRILLVDDNKAMLTRAAGVPKRFARLLAPKQRAARRSAPRRRCSRK
jgi:hypothetical protein